MSKFVMYLDTNLDYPGLQRLFQAFKMPGQKASKGTKLEPLLRNKNNIFQKMCGSCLMSGSCHLDRAAYVEIGVEC